MKQRKLDVFFFFPSYGGNGGISSEVPDIRHWYTQVILKAKDDPRIGGWSELTRGDTPVTMVRNLAVMEARQVGADVLVMVDSDISPLKHAKEAYFNEFFSSSFDFLYEHYDQGPVVVGAPYCGPPNGSENMYVFEWEGVGDRGDETPFSMEIIPRHVASKMFGIQECAALPTGLIMYDMRAFELIEPSKLKKHEVLDLLIDGEITKDQALSLLHDGWFYYEWTDQYAWEKASTEDVTNTRDISLVGCLELGYNPVFCNWSSPVGHWKPWCVDGKPPKLSALQIASSFRRACDCEINADEALVDAKWLIEQRKKKSD